MKIKLTFGIALILLGLSISIHAQTTQWNGFRGNNRDGRAQCENLNTDWNANAPQMVYQISATEGFSEVAVDDRNFYLQGVDTLAQKEYLTAYSIKNGKEVWKTEIDSMYFENDGWGHGPRATPAIDEETIFVLTAFGKLKAFDKKNGKELWMRNIPTEFSGPMPRWGFSSSPVLFGDMLLQETGGGEGKALTAFDKATGKELWSRGNGTTSYNSPQRITIDGVDQVIFTIDTMLNSYNEKGDLLWAYRMPMRGFTASPVMISPNRIFCSAVGRVGCFVIEINDNEVTEIYQNRSMQNNWSSSVYHDGYIYGSSRARLMCIDATTGEVQWNQRGFGKASMILVDDHLMVLSDEGLLALVEANPEAYVLKGSQQVLEGKSWTAPSYADGHIYVRNLSQFSSIKIKK